MKFDLPLILGTPNRVITNTHVIGDPILIIKDEDYVEFTKQLALKSKFREWMSGIYAGKETTEWSLIEFNNVRIPFTCVMGDIIRYGVKSDTGVIIAFPLSLLYMSKTTA